LPKTALLSFWRPLLAAALIGLLGGRRAACPLLGNPRSFSDQVLPPLSLGKTLAAPFFPVLGFALTTVLLGLFFLGAIDLWRDLWVVFAQKLDC
jgi:hypothetical protein